MRTKREREKLTFSPTKILQLNSITDTGFKLVGTTIVFDLKVTAAINWSMMKWVYDWVYDEVGAQGSGRGDPNLPCGWATWPLELNITY